MVSSLQAISHFTSTWPHIYYWILENLCIRYYCCFVLYYTAFSKGLFPLGCCDHSSGRTAHRQAQTHHGTMSNIFLIP
jgi:hypothetical protein